MRLTALVCVFGMGVAMGGCDRAPVPASSSSEPSSDPTSESARGSAAGRAGETGGPDSDRSTMSATAAGRLQTPPPGHAAGGPAPSVPLPPNPDFARPAMDPAHPALAGVTWEAPDPFQHRAPSSSMRAAEYVVAGAAGEAVMTVFHFPGMGGSTEDNVRRWTGQFEGGHAETETVQRDGLEITTIDTRGTFRGMQGMSASTRTPANAEQRLLGAIVVGPNGPVFFKLTGPVETVSSAESAFEHFVGSLRPAAP